MKCKISQGIPQIVVVFNMYENWNHRIRQSHTHTSTVDNHFVYSYVEAKQQRAKEIHERETNETKNLKKREKKDLFVCNKRTVDIFNQTSLSISHTTYIITIYAEIIYLRLCIYMKYFVRAQQKEYQH